MRAKEPGGRGGESSWIGKVLNKGLGTEAGIQCVRARARAMSAEYAF